MQKAYRTAGNLTQKKRILVSLESSTLQRVKSIFGWNQSVQTFHYTVQLFVHFEATSVLYLSQTQSEQAIQGANAFLINRNLGLITT